MLIIANNDEEEASAWKALEVINQLRRREAKTVQPDLRSTTYTNTRWAKPEYL